MNLNFNFFNQNFIFDSLLEKSEEILISDLSNEESIKEIDRVSAKINDFAKEALQFAGIINEFNRNRFDQTLMPNLTFDHNPSNLQEWKETFMHGVQNHPLNEALAKKVSKKINIDIDQLRKEILEIISSESNQIQVLEKIRNVLNTSFERLNETYIEEWGNSLEYRIKNI